MDRKKMIWSAIQGFGFVFLLSQTLAPEPQVFYLTESEGSFRVSTDEESVEVEIQEVAEGLTKVRFEESWTAWDYGFWIGLGLLLTSLSCRQKEPKSDELKDVEKDEPPIDPLYEQFLAEDANRKLFPRSKLEREFSIWKDSRPSPENRAQKIPAP